MSDKEEEDMFADSDDSDDTAELIAQSATKKKAPPAEPKKGAAAAAAAAPPKDDDDDDDDDSDDDGGLFDSDSEDEEAATTAAAKKRKTLQQAAAQKPLSKRERLEALAKQRQRKEAPKSAASGGNIVDSVPEQQKNKDESSKTNKGDGYESEDTYDSGDFQRTKEDDDFLDTTGEDAEAVQELYAEQRFDDERPDGSRKNKKKRRYRDDEAIEDNGDAEPDNPIMAAVHRMKRKKRQKKSFTEMEDECKTFLGRMEMAAENDEQAISERRPALEKLSMLNEVVDTLTRRDMQRMLLDFDLLTVCRRWIQPLPNGTLGNVTVRQKLLTAIGNMTGENGISANDLKRSELGKTVMVLYKHRAETPAMKRQLKALIEQWSRPIFQKSGNMRDLERVHASRGEGGLAALSRQRVMQTAQSAQKSAANDQDLDSLITSGKKSGGESGIHRVRVPFSKGFSYSVRPSARDDANADRSMARQGTGTKDTRGKLSKRMVEKGRKVSKNQRSANISIEGRPTK